MTLSYSALKMFETCPRQFHEVRILKKYTSSDTTATIWGKEVHENAELFIRDGRPFAIQFTGSDQVEALAKLRGDKHCEMELAVNDKLEPVAFSDPSAMLRGIADLVIINGDSIRVIDYKTGSNKYPDPAQLELMALLVFAKFPEAQRSHGALLFLAHNDIVQKITKREDSATLWANWFGKINRIEESHKTGVWNAKSSGLCKKYCPVKTCEHNGGYYAT